MTLSALALPVTCTLAIADLRLSHEDGHIIEHGTYEILGEPHCPWVDVHLPPGSSLVRLKGKLRAGSGGTRSIDGPRLDPRVEQPDGRSVIRIHTPDLRAADRLDLRVTRRLKDYEWSWQPASQRVRYAEIESDRPFMLGGKSVNQAWTASPDPEWIASMDGPAFPASSEWPSPSPETQARWSYTLDIPGDPNRSLYPGGGSRLHTKVSFQTAPQSSPAFLTIPLPSEHTNLVVTGEHVVRERSVLLEIGPEGGNHTIAFTHADAPSHGSIPKLAGAESTLEVTVETGRVRWANDRWRLVSIDGRTLSPTGLDLARAIDRRFGRANIPEPALPSAVRGVPPSADLVQVVRALQLGRAGVADLPLDPVFPRPTIRARRSGAMTSVEAALALMAQLRQAGMKSTWGLIDPGPPADASVATVEGYSRGVVLVDTPAGAQFIDPSCDTCGSYELPLELYERALFSQVGTKTPPLPALRVTVEPHPDEGLEVTLSPGLAGHWRARLQDVAPTQRKAALREWLGTTELMSTRGLSAKGERLVFVVRSFDEAALRRTTSFDIDIRQPNPPPEASLPAPPPEETQDSVPPTELETTPVPPGDLSPPP